MTFHTRRPLWTMWLGSAAFSGALAQPTSQQQQQKSIHLMKYFINTVKNTYFIEHKKMLHKSCIYFIVYNDEDVYIVLSCYLQKTKMSHWICSVDLQPLTVKCKNVKPPEKHLVYQHREWDVSFPVMVWVREQRPTLPLNKNYYHITVCP